MLGKIEGWRRRGQQRIRWLDGITDSVDMSLNSESWWWTGRPGMLQSMRLQRVRHNWAIELNWILKRATQDMKVDYKLLIIKNTGNDIVAAKQIRIILQITLYIGTLYIVQEYIGTLANINLNYSLSQKSRLKRNSQLSVWQVLNRRICFLTSTTSKLQYL